jgi:hypothetical protein
VLDTPNTNLAVVPAPNDHSLNVLWLDGANKQHLWVYDTEANGAPQAQPIQKLGVSAVSQFLVNPNGKFDYILGKLDELE